VSAFVNLLTADEDLVPPAGDAPEGERSLYTEYVRAHPKRAPLSEPPCPLERAHPSEPTPSEPTPSEPTPTLPAPVQRGGFGGSPPNNRSACPLPPTGAGAQAKQQTMKRSLLLVRDAH
jgi:hypothetical protein